MSRDYLFRYFYRWVSTMKNAHVCHDKNIVCFCNDKYHAHIIFYKEFNMMELSIEDKWTEKNVFYLHFEMMDILSTRKNILSFFQFLKDENHHNKVNSSLKLSSLKILICCTSGLTSHYYASLMQQAQQNIIVDAYPIMNVEDVANDSKFLKEYDEVVNNFNSYMETKETWFSKNYPNNKNDLIAYFSAEYGIDEILPIYSGGLGILSGDHLKSASDLGLPFAAVGLLYKNGYFNQKIDGYGNQKTEYNNIDLDNLPILPVKDEEGNDLIIDVEFPDRKLYLKVWKIIVGRISLYLMDSDIDQNIAEDGRRFRDPPHRRGI